MEHCRDIERELTGYEGGELSPTEHDRVRNHLDQCAECRAELARERKLRKTLGALPLVSSPAGLNQRIKETARRESRPAPTRTIRHRLAATLSVAAAGLVLVIILPTLRPSPGLESVSSEDRQSWSDQDIAAARKDVLFSLALTARVLDRTRKEVVVEVFANQLPRAVNESLKSVKPTTPGGNG